MINHVILASGSPRRRELLDQIGLNYEVVVSGVDEAVDPALSPVLTVERLALLKAADVAKTQDEHALVIGADTVVLLDGEILGKPGGEDAARVMLGRLSGRGHSVLTGLSVVRNQDAKCVSVCVETRVFMKQLTEDEIDAYIGTGEPLDKAGAYGIQGIGAMLVERIEGDYSNVVGLPLFKLAEIFREEFGIDLMGEHQ